MSYPRVTVLLPVLDEADNIDACLKSVADQEFPDDFEVIVADGGSIDGTVERAASWRDRLPELRIIDNPGRVQSHGLNLSAGQARGEILVRMDAHTTYAPDYLRLSVDRLLDSGATAVGGIQRAIGRSSFGKAVAAALSSPFAVGPALYRHTSNVTEADTVYLGAMRKADWERLGGWRMLPSHVAEDADLYYRWRLQGARILVDPRISSTYRPRETAGGVWRQFFKYGLGKADMLYVNGRWPSWRPLAPLALVLGLVVGTIIGLVWSWWPLLALVVLWAITLVAASRARPLVMAATALMQLAYGLGLLRGLLRWPPAVRAQVE